MCYTGVNLVHTHSYITVCICVCKKTGYKYKRGQNLNTELPCTPGKPQTRLLKESDNMFPLTQPCTLEILWFVLQLRAYRFNPILITIIQVALGLTKVVLSNIFQENGFFIRKQNHPHAKAFHTSVLQKCRDLGNLLAAHLPRKRKTHKHEISHQAWIRYWISISGKSHTGLLELSLGEWGGKPRARPCYCPPLLS